MIKNEDNIYKQFKHGFIKNKYIIQTEQTQVEFDRNTPKFICYIKCIWYFCFFQCLKETWWWVRSDYNNIKVIIYFILFYEEVHFLHGSCWPADAGVLFFCCVTGILFSSRLLDEILSILTSLATVFDAHFWSF